MIEKIKAELLKLWELNVSEHPTVPLGKIIYSVIAAVIIIVLLANFKTVTSSMAFVFVVWIARGYWDNREKKSNNTSTQP